MSLCTRGRNEVLRSVRCTLRRMSFSANDVWNIALLEPGADPFDISVAREIRVFSSRQIRKTGRDVHTRADPFLFVHEKYLYVFYEVQRVGEPGRIEAMRTDDLLHFECIGTVLAPGDHVSYPLVFEDGGRVFMVPESEAVQEVALYEFESFPHRLRKVRTLLQGCNADSTLFRHSGLWWLFTSAPEGLKLFFADDLQRPFEQHPAGVLTRDAAFARCGGAVLHIDGALYRPAQDCSSAYGGNLSMMRIDEITPTIYRESPIRLGIFDRERPWRSQGAHHFSKAHFNGRTVVAVDGKQRDYWINRPISILLRELQWTTKSGKSTSAN